MSSPRSPPHGIPPTNSGVRAISSVQSGLRPALLHALCWVDLAVNETHLRVSRDSGGITQTSSDQPIASALHLIPEFQRKGSLGHFALYAYPRTTAASSRRPLGEAKPGGERGPQSGWPGCSPLSALRPRAAGHHEIDAPTAAVRAPPANSGTSPRPAATKPSKSASRLR